jgi:3-oxoacyl-[acyl-carrier protein] reductase
MLEFADQVVIVTGGGGGIGAAAAERFAEYGARVVVADLNLEAAQEVANQIGARAFATRLDHTKVESCQACVGAALEKWNRVDVLCAVAGLGRTGAFESQGRDFLLSTVDINLVGPWQMAQAALPALASAAAERPQIGSSIIFTSSGQGLHGAAGAAAYSAAKHGVIGLMRSLALELGPRNIRVTAVCPGFVATHANRQATAAWGDFETVKKGFAEKTPLRRTAEPVDIANAMVFLASDAGRMIHGHSLVVDGGVHGH